MTASSGWRYEHAAQDFTVDLPTDARLVSDLPPLFALDGRARDHVPAIAVTSEPLDAGRSLEDWVDSALANQGRQFRAARLIDRERDSGDSPQRERTLSSVVDGGRGLTVAQWWQRGRDRGWMLTASCATLDYGALAEAFEAIGESFAPR